MRIDAMAIDLETPARYLKGVGPRRAGILEGAHIHTAGDLLRYLPFRYEDRSRFLEIRSLRADQECVIQTTVLVAGGYTTSRQGTKIFEVLVRDGSGSMPVKFFNQQYLSKVFKRGQSVVFYGVPKFDRFSNSLSMLNPDFEILGEESDPTLHTGRIVPIYRRIEDMSSRVLRQIIFKLIQDLEPDLEDPLPGALRKRWKFPGLRDSFRQVHFPDSGGPEENAVLLAKLAQHQTPAFRRLIFEEFFLFQRGLQLIRRRRLAIAKNHHITINDRVRDRLKSLLPFHLTGAQKRVLKEIVDDLRATKPMSRLLQGDVGSGKTIVALLSAAVVIENGYQVCLMAPTELLAEQHYRTSTQVLEAAGYRVELLTSATKKREREALHARLKAGEVDLLVGTHALIQGTVEFRELALAIIDEQHRFGVLQRSRLMEKGSQPDTLVMTATPIPRSLALTVYGDLDVSVLDELPPGRQPVKTVIKAEQSRDEVYRVIRKHLEQDRQVYIVYPLVEESAGIDLKAATEMAEHLSLDVFPDFRVGLMHGRLKSKDKDELMAEFLAGSVRILVSTTVIEVGIDVPNASVMVIEHAERFGLSQLHQLRGRIGRGRDPGLCILLVDRVSSKEAYERLEIMRRTNDGFVIAEKDLEIRGPGQFAGTRQSGMPEFFIGNVLKDRRLLEMARREAEQYVAALDPSDPDSEREMARLAAEWKDRYGLFQIG
ncbi:MAG: ATP-dependent DNA helicase RecG [Acidobacteriota bacterium]